MKKEIKAKIIKHLPKIAFTVAALVVIGGAIFFLLGGLSEETALRPISEKKDFRLDEEPELRFKYKKVESDLLILVEDTLRITDYWKDINVQADIKGPTGKILDIQPALSFKNNGEFFVKVEKARAFQPGLYKIVLKIEDNSNGVSQVRELEQDFSWGVLAINTNKSIYLSGDRAYLQMTVLDDKGHTVCDADLVLNIKYLVSGIETVLSTKDGTIQRSSECGPETVTYTPDYFAYYQVGKLGIYQMKLTNLDNSYEITDSFEVRDSLPFDIERIGPTRIYPPVTYEMRMIVKTNKDFEGRISERVPARFAVKPGNNTGFKMYVLEGIQDIFWDVHWKKGEIYELIYEFDAPDISPYLYLLGPLQIGDFQEIRQWQIASDVTIDSEDWEAFADADVTLDGSFWSNITGDDCDMQVDSGGTPSSDTGPSVDHTYGDATHKYLYLETSSGWCQGVGLYAGLESDNIDADTYSAEIDFWYHMYGSTIGTSTLDVYDGSWHNDIWYQEYLNEDVWKNASTSLDAYTGTIKLRFRSIANGDYYGDIAYDDIVITGETRVTNPDAPILYNADDVQISFNNVKQATTTPRFRVSATCETDFDEFQIEMSTSSTFDMATHTQSFFSTYASGTQYNLHATSLDPILPTTDGLTYYVRARAATSSNWGNWSTSTWSFTYNDAEADPMWFQTTDEQFGTGALDDTATTGADSVQLSYSVGAVSILDAWSGTTGLTTFSLNYTPTSGNDRLLMIAIWTEDTAVVDSISSVDFGGQTLTKVDATNGEAITGTGYSNSTWLGYLLDADIPAGATTFDQTDITWPTGAPDGAYNPNIGAAVVVLQGVDQADPIGETDKDEGTTSGTVVSAGPVNVVDGDMVVATAFVGQPTTDPPTFTGYTIGYSFTGESNSFNGVVGTKQITADGTETPEVTWAAASRIGMVAAVINAATGGFMATGTVMSTAIDYDWLVGATSWGEFSWSEDEATGTVKAQLWYDTTTSTCDTCNATATDWFTDPGSHDISGLTTSTYKCICIKAQLDRTGTSTPYLQDWTVEWITAPPAAITISGNVYSNEGTTAIGDPPCDDTTPVVKLKVNGTGNASSTCDSSTGAYSISDLSLNTTDIVTVFLDTGGGKKAVTVSKGFGASTTDFHLYQDRVIVRHEEATALTITDMDNYDNGEDPDIQFTATTSPSVALLVDANAELYIWPEKEFAPGGNITLDPGGSGDSWDGSLKICSTSTFAATGTESHSIGGSWFASSTATFAAASSTITFTATTTGKKIWTNSQSFYNLVFDGSNGGWQIMTAASTTNDLTMATGTLSGTQDLSVYGGNATGTNGVIDLTGGTFTLAGTGNFGANAAWTFNNLTFGDGSSATTSKIGSGDIEVKSVLNIASNQTLNAGSEIWNLSGSGTPFSISGNFEAQSSVFKYTSVANATATAAAYYQLEFMPGSGSPTFYLGSGTFTTNNHLYIGDSSNAVTVTANTNDPTLNIIGDFEIRNNATFTASNSGGFSVAGSWSNSGTFNHSSGTVTLDDTSGGKTIDAGSSPFYTLTFDGVSGGWQLSTSTLDVDNNLNLTNGTLDASSQNITMAGNLTLASGGSFTKGTGTTTFDGSGTNTWTDNNATKQDMGNVVIDGSSKTINLNSDVKATRLTIGADNTFGPGSYTFTITGSGTGASRPFIVNGNFNEGASLAEFTATTTTDIESATYYNLKLNQSGTTFQLYNNATTTNDINIAAGTLDVTTNNYNLVIGGNWTNSGTFNARNGTVTLDGTSQQTLSGTLTGSSAFNILTITNQSGTDPQTDPGVIFATSTTAATSTVTTDSVKLRFNAGSTFTFTNINWNGQATSTRVTLRSSSADTQWYLVVTSSQTVLNVDAKDSNACGGDYIYATDPSNYDSGNNDCWYFVAITVSGIVYSDEGSTGIGVNKTVTLKVNGAGSCNGEVCTAETTSGGNYSISSVIIDNAGDVITVFLDGESQKAVTVTRATSTSANISGFHLYQNRIIVRHEDSGPITIDDLAYYDSDNDPDILFTAASSTDTLTASSTSEFFVWSGMTFETGGAGGSISLSDLDINGTFTATSSQTISVACNAGFTNASCWDVTGGTFNSASSTVEFTSNTTGKTITVNDNPFWNLTFNNASGGWTISDTNATTSNNFTITTGAVTSTSGILAVGGNFDSSGGTFNHNDGTVKLIASSAGKTVDSGASFFYNLEFNNGSGGWTISSSNATTSNNFTISAGAVTSTSGILAVGGDFDNSGTFNHNSGTLKLFATSTGHSITPGGSALNNITFDGVNGGWSFATPGNHTVANDFTIDNGAVTSTAGTLSVGGAWSNSSVFNHNDGTVTFTATSESHNITSGGYPFWGLTFDGIGGSWALQDALDVNDAFTLTNGTTTQDADTNINWGGNVAFATTGATFIKASGSGIVIFDGSSQTYEDNSSPQQNLGDVQIGTSPGTTNLNSDMTADSLTVSDGDNFNTRGYDLDITEYITINGTLNASDTKAGNATLINLGTDWIVNSSTGNFVHATSTITFDEGTASVLTSGGTTDNFDFYNLSFSKSSTATTTLSSYAIKVNNDLSIGANSILDVSGSDYDITVGGNWSNSGTFEAQGGTVTFIDSAATSTFSGATTFFNLTCTTTNKGLEFATGTSATTTISGTLILDGQACDTAIKLRSASPGSQWYINATATTTLNYLDIKDSNAVTALTAENSVDTYNNNTNWTINGGVCVSALIQLDYRWYANVDALNPDTPLDATNTAITNATSGTVYRIRMNIRVTNQDLGAGEQAFTLEYATTTYLGSCTSSLDWTTVGQPSSSIAWRWRGYDNPSIADETTVTSTLLTSSDVMESYEEKNDSVVNPNAISSNQAGEWDWVVQYNVAYSTTTYCFRMVKTGGALLDSYTNYPKVTSYGPASWKADEDVNITGVSTSTNVRLRFLVANISTTTAATNYNYQIEYAPKTGDCTSETYTPTPISTSTGPFEMATSSYFRRESWGGDPTSHRLNDPDSYTFTAGELVEDPYATTTDITLNAEIYTEVEYKFYVTAQASEGWYCFRVTDNGTDLDSYDTYAQMQIGAPVGIDITGVCKEYDESTNCANGRTIKVAVNNSLKAQSATTSNGEWTISGVDVSQDDIVTVWIDGVDAANEATAVTKYDGSTNITGMKLYERHLTIGSDDQQTITNTNLDQYTNGNNEDIMHEVTGGVLTVDDDGAYADEELYILTNNTFAPGGNTNTHDIEIQGTFTAAGTETHTINGSWVNNGTFTAASSEVKFTSTSIGETIITNSQHFYKLTFDGSGGGWSFATGTDHYVDNNFKISNGTVTSTDGTLQVNGNWLVEANGAFNHNEGTVAFKATDTGHTINPGSSPFKIVTFDSSTGGWTITADATSTGNWNITNAQEFIATSSVTIEVQGEYNIATSTPAVTDWKSDSKLYLNGTSQTVGNKSQDKEIYATLKIGDDTDIRMWNSTSTTYTVDSTGSLYSQDHNDSNGSLYVWGDFHTTSTDYWSYATDFDGTGGANRQCQVTINSTTLITIDSGESLEIKGGGYGSSDIATVTYAPASGSWNLNNDSGSELVFQEATIGHMKVNSGTITVLNTTLNDEATPASGATLNTDWYLGVHAVDAATTSVDIASGTTTISEHSTTSQATIWRHNGSVWGTPSTTQITQTNASGTIPQPGSDGAIRIREYKKEGATTTYYKYNLEITADGFSNYDYFDSQGENYIISTSSPETENVDRCIWKEWQRDNITVNNQEPSLNSPPDDGTWYAGMSSDLEFSIIPTSVNLDLDSPDYTDTATTTLYATTSYPGGYTVKAYAGYEGRLRLDESHYIERWDHPNSTPAVWTSRCIDGSQWCGFGYNTDDDNLGGGGESDRFVSNKYAGFATSSPGDIVADATSSVPTGDEHIITYKTSVLKTKTAGEYETSVYYLCTVTY